ncbi:MAG: sigma-70 family RNA polymerase sigma factor [Terriglobales bacterium]
MPQNEVSKSPFTEQEFARIHTSYDRQLFFWFRKRVKHPDVAEELAADTLMKLWESDFRGDCALSTWIYCLAKSVLTDWRRSTKRQNEFLEDAMENRVALERKYMRRDESGPITWEEGAEATDPTPNPEQQAIIRDQLVGHFSDPRLDSLDYETKQMLLRYFVEQERVEDIAADLGVTPSAIYKRILRVCPKS